jgi:hypothetical protein
LFDRGVVAVDVFCFVATISGGLAGIDLSDWQFETLSTQSHHQTAPWTSGRQQTPSGEKEDRKTTIMFGMTEGYLF